MRWAVEDRRGLKLISNGNLLNRVGKFWIVMVQPKVFLAQQEVEANPWPWWELHCWFSANFGHCVAFKAEVLALMRGLDLANNMHIQQLEVQLDSLACIQALQSNRKENRAFTHKLNYCREMIENPQWKVWITHIYREGNRAADWLANNGVIQEERLVILRNIPVALRRIMEEDMRGVAFPRLIPP